MFVEKGVVNRRLARLVKPKKAEHQNNTTI
jgi:hypothetical protein